METLTLPVAGMTCASCSVRVQRALEKTPGVTRASVNLMLENAAVTFDRTAVSPASLVSVIEQTGYGSSLPVTQQSALDEQAAQDRAHEEEYREVRRKAIASLAAASLGMLISMPLMRGACRRSCSRPRRRADRSLPGMVTSRDRPLAVQRDAVALRRGPRCAVVESLHDHCGGHGVGRRSLLRARLEGLPAPRGRHEHAGRGRHRSGLRLLGPRHRRPDPPVLPRRLARRVLRGGALHHRAHSRGEHLRGAREAPDLSGLACAGRPAAEDGARAPRWPGGRRAGGHRGGRRHRPGAAWGARAGGWRDPGGR